MKNADPSLWPGDLDLQLRGEEENAAFYMKSLFKHRWAFFLIIVSAFSYYFLVLEE